MKVILYKAFLLISFVFCLNIGYGQTNKDSLMNNEINFELKSDTLRSNTGLKLYVGQKLIVGNASGEGGRFRSIVSNKAAIVPSIWGQDKRFENAIENYVDSKKNKEKLRNSLIPGHSLAIDKIVLSKTGRPHFYMITLSSDSVKCRADIKLALILGELLLR